MAIGLVGRKCGMTRVFTDAGESIPVSVIEVEPNRVTRVITVESDGYDAIQVTTGTRRASRVTQPLAGHYAKANVEAGRGLWEFRVTPEQLQAKAEDEGGEGGAQGIAVGSEIKVNIFAEGQLVDVTGISKGKGFAGVIKRHHFAAQDATHGNSRSHRAAGSTGQNQTPGRVFKGKKMAGHLGNKQRTTQNLEVVRIDVARNLILVKGAIPGAPGGNVIVRTAVKSKTKRV